MIERDHKPMKRLLSAEAIEEETSYSSTENDQPEFSIRPKKLSEYIGQQEIKNNLEVFIRAAQQREEALEHVLLYGAPGLGKTTLAHIIASEMGVNCKITSGPALEKQGDIAAILSNLGDRDVLFIDEIHRLKPGIEEVLYTAMEDYAIDIVLGKGPSARTMRINLPKFTLIGATTKMSMLSSPLRDRFGHSFHLDFYTAEDIVKILVRSAGLFEFELEDEAAKFLAKSSRHTPRIANRLLRRSRDFAQVHGKKIIDLLAVSETMKALNIDHLGLDTMDRTILKTIIDKFDGGPVGLNTLAAATSQEEATLEVIYEPYLLKLGLIDRTPRGRVVTRHAYEHLGLSSLIE